MEAAGRCRNDDDPACWPSRHRPDLGPDIGRCHGLDAASGDEGGQGGLADPNMPTDFHELDPAFGYQAPDEPGLGPHPLRRLLHRQQLISRLGLCWHYATLWDSELLMGWYAANEGSIRSKGTMYFVLHPHGLTMSGRWVGLGYDGRIMTGWAAMGQTQEEAEDTMQKLIASEGVAYVDD
jgi:hypothetical protein